MEKEMARDSFQQTDFKPAEKCWMVESISFEMTKSGQIFKKNRGFYF